MHELSDQEISKVTWENVHKRAMSGQKGVTPAPCYTVPACCLGQKSLELEELGREGLQVHSFLLAAGKAHGSMGGWEG